MKRHPRAIEFCSYPFRSKRTQSLKKLKKENQEIALSPTQFRKLGSSKFIDVSKLDETDSDVYNSIYYKEVPIESKKLSETLIVTYSPKYKDYQRKIRSGQIDRAQKMVDSGKSKKTHRNPNDPARFITKTAVTENGEVAEQQILQLNTATIEDEERFDEFYAVTTVLRVMYLRSSKSIRDDGRSKNVSEL